MLKITILLTIICISITNNPTNIPFDHSLALPYIYKNDATQWVHLYMDNSSPKDLQLTLNLLYLSYKRSLSNLQTQILLERTAKTANDLFTTFLKTRLNPGLYKKINLQATDDSCASIWQSMEEHRTAGLSYDAAVRYILDNHMIISLAANDGIKALRQKARDNIARAFVTVIDNIDNLIDAAHFVLDEKHNSLINRRPLSARWRKTIWNNTTREETFSLLSATEFTVINRGIFEQIWRYLKILFANAFLEADKEYTEAFSQVLSALTAVNEIHNSIWYIIEQVRAAFYYAHYSALYEYMQQKKVDANYFCLLFDETGIKNTCIASLTAFTF